MTAHHSPLTTHHSPLTTHHSPLTTHHSPLTTHHSILRCGRRAPNALTRSILTARLLPLLELIEQVGPGHGDFRDLEQLLNEFGDGGLRLAHAFDFAGQSAQPIGRLH